MKSRWWGTFCTQKQKFCHWATVTLVHDYKSWDISRGPATGIFISEISQEATVECPSLTYSPGIFITLLKVQNESCFILFFQQNLILFPVRLGLYSYNAKISLLISFAFNFFYNPPYTKKSGWALKKLHDTIDMKQYDSGPGGGENYFKRSPAAVSVETQPQWATAQSWKGKLIWTNKEAETPKLPIYFCAKPERDRSASPS